MRSKWIHLKEEATRLRREGYSIGNIEKKLSIPRSTLSGWFRYITLTKSQKRKLEENWKIGLVKARKKAVLWHNNQKLKRIEDAEKEALDIISGLELKNQKIVELGLAILYLGEGFKKSDAGLGNSDPLIMKFFVTILTKIYLIPKSKMRCELHLRADQDPIKIKNYWSKELKITLDRFNQVSIDKRTLGSPTYPGYKGVCIVHAGGFAMQRKLVYLSRIFCQKIIENLGG